MRAAVSLGNQALQGLSPQPPQCIPRNGIYPLMNFAAARPLGLPRVLAPPPEEAQKAKTPTPEPFDSETRKVSLGSCCTEPIHSPEGSLARGFECFPAQHSSRLPETRSCLTLMLGVGGGDELGYPLFQRLFAPCRPFPNSLVPAPWPCPGSCWGPSSRQAGIPPASGPL